MNCNKCIKRIDCKIYEIFKDEVSADWSTENNYCNMYQGVDIYDSFEELLDELKTAQEVNEELIEEKEELREDIANYKSLIAELESAIEDALNNNLQQGL